MTRRLRGLILNFDGTIAETERLGQRVAYNRAFRQLGLDWFWDEEVYADLLTVADGKERLRYYVTRYRPEMLDDTTTAGLLVELHRAKIRYFAASAPTISLRTGVLRLIREARAAGLEVAIATTASIAGVEALLSQEPELPQLIRVIAASDAVEREKPAPDVYLWAFEQLGLDATYCVAIEDSNVGLRAALAADLRTVATVSDYAALENFTGATAVLTDLGEREKPARRLRGIAPSHGIADLDFLEAVLTSSA